MERFAPSVRLRPSAEVVTPPGWMWVLGFAMGGCDWAIEACQSEEFKTQARDWFRARALDRVESEMAHLERETREVPRAITIAARVMSHEETCGCGYDGGLRRYCAAHNPAFGTQNQVPRVGSERDFREVRIEYRPDDRIMFRVPILSTRHRDQEVSVSQSVNGAALFLTVGDRQYSIDLQRLAGDWLAAVVEDDRIGQ